MALELCKIWSASRDKGQMVHNHRTATKSVEQVTAGGLFMQLHKVLKCGIQWCSNRTTSI